MLLYFAWPQNKVSKSLTVVSMTVHNSATSNWNEPFCNEGVAKSSCGNINDINDIMWAQALLTYVQLASLLSLLNIEWPSVLGGVFKAAAWMVHAAPQVSYNVTGSLPLPSLATGYALTSMQYAPFMHPVCPPVMQRAPQVCKTLKCALHSSKVPRHAGVEPLHILCITL